MVKDGFEANFPTEVIKEGKVQVLVPKLEAYGVIPSDYAPSRAPVFYNPVMEFNRDLTVLAFRAYQHMVNHEISICDPLTSQGIRGLRFATEIEGVKRVLISDINERAYKLAKHNVELNGLEGKIVVKHKDANAVLSCNASPKKRFDIVDIDPFGTPAPYLDSALRAVKNNGLLASTATDLAPLCGVHVKACIRKYGGRSLRTEYCHELAVRLLIGCTAAVAAKHDIGIKVFFSHSSEHYIRVYTQIAYGAKKSDESIKTIGYILHCFNCYHRETTYQPFNNLQCPECGSKMDWAGPIWLGNIFDYDFIGKMMVENKSVAFKNSSRITKILNITQEEVSASKTYFVIDKLSGKLGLPSLSTQSFINLLRKSGFQAVQTHFNTRGVRTDAPITAINKLLKGTSGS
jgi:tRNA (guanine26-N2/guanine27-N2)-dimethyltransferase